MEAQIFIQIRCLTFYWACPIFCQDLTRLPMLPSYFIKQLKEMIGQGVGDYPYCFSSALVLLR